MNRKPTGTRALQDIVDVVAPLGLLFLVGLIGVIVFQGRKQRAAKRTVFMEFAKRRGYSYRETDDGTVEQQAAGFERFATFYSPSIGKNPAHDVVQGQVDEGTVWSFRHGTPDLDGQAREWFVCLLATRQKWQGFMRITPRDSEKKQAREIGGQPVISVGVPEFDDRFVIRSDSDISLLNEDARQVLMTALDALAFLPEIQLKDGNVVIYPADRNVVVDSPGQLDALLKTATSLAEVLAK